MCCYRWICHGFGLLPVKPVKVVYRMPTEKLYITKGILPGKYISNLELILNNCRYTIISATSSESIAR